MLFSSVSFLYFFLPLVLILYYLSRNRLWRNAVLLLASLVFYSWGEPRFLLLMLFSALAAYLCGLGIEHYRDRTRIRKLFLVLSLVILLGCLVVFKYLTFLCDNLSALTGLPIPLPAITLPIGISFYTFQILSYVIDLYRGRVSVQRSYFRFLLYVSFFPQLIAGPIVRYETVESEMYSRSESWDDVICGLRRFIVGLAKKVIIANNVAVVCDTIFDAPSLAGTLALWLAALCYTLQIYFDFSGYSDMAIGLGRMFGFHFLENFNYPYAASSITDFWRRWHISMASWFRDYVYIPLGGSRVSLPRHVFNILVVWSLTGLWHGAAWNYLLWGVLNALLLLFEKFILHGRADSFPRPLRRLYTSFLILVSMTVFYFEDIPSLCSVLQKMFLFTPSSWAALLNLDTAVCFKLLFILPGLVFSFPVVKRLRLSSGTGGALVSAFLYAALLAVSITFIISSSYNPFIYFRF